MEMLILFMICYLGFGVECGCLDVDIEVLIEDGWFDSIIKIVVDKFYLGEWVDSE